MRIDDFKKLSEQELLEVTGGGCVEDCIESVRDALCAAWEWLKSRIEPNKGTGFGAVFRLHD